MAQYKPYSLVTIVLIFIFIFNQFSDKINDVIEDKNTCICEYDGFGYYMYLPYLLEHGSLAVKQDWAQDLQNKYCGGKFVYQIINHRGRGEINIYHMGLAYLHLPAFTIAHITAKQLGYETNGMSKPYHLAYIFTCLLFMLLGLFYLRKMLLLFVKDGTAALAILSVFLASNATVIFEKQYQLPHLFLFALNTIFFYYLILFYRNEKVKYLYISAIILGITFTIRPTQALFGLIPAILFYHKYGLTKTFRKHILFYPIFAILIDLPQLIYWLYAVGSPFVFNLHVQDMALTQPNLIDFLFSYKKGWLLYSPLFLILIPSFWKLKQRNKRLYSALLLVSVIYIYVMSSWTCWWYATSYSSRVMVDIYPFFILIIALFFESIKSIYAKIGIGIFIVLCIIQNQIQIIQLNKHYLHNYRMTKAHYWYIFGKTEIRNFNDSLLEINRDDYKWPKDTSITESDAYQIKEQEILHVTNITAKSDIKQEFKITEIPFKDFLKTDETLIEVSIKTKTSNNNANVTFHVRTESTRSTYGWNEREISKGLSENEFTTHNYKFNLPNVRFKDDFFRIFLRLPGDADIEIESLTLKATSLIRK